MTLSDLVKNAYLRATGEVSSLSTSDSDYTKIVELANMNVRAWAAEDDWASLYDPGVNIGTVTATDTFDLDDSIYRISNQPDDFVQITGTDGTVTNYRTVEPNRLKAYPDGHYCARVGRTLKFNKAFTASDPQYDGTITVPAYVLPDELVNATDGVPVDNPDWLAVMTAALWTQTDITLAQNYPGLVAEANNLMEAMKQANRAQYETVDLGSVGISTEW